MIKVTVSFTAVFDADDLPPIYLNEDMLSEVVAEYIEDSLNELSPSDLSINRLDIEGL